jgi:hypothetical protein
MARKQKQHPCGHGCQNCRRGWPLIRYSPIIQWLGLVVGEGRESSYKGTSRGLFQTANIRHVSQILEPLCMGHLMITLVKLSRVLHILILWPEMSICILLQVSRREFDGSIIQNQSANMRQLSRPCLKLTYMT